MQTRSDYRIVAISHAGMRFIVGTGFTVGEADIVCRRLRNWTTYSEVVMERIAAQQTPSVLRPIRPAVLTYTRRLQRVLAALGIL